MADSVDRVFSHALNTVNKIRTGSQKPPSTTRLRLYGLYKQAMEGDVDGIMDRPEGSGEQELRAREKWDAWKQQNNLSRTEAKRRYITTLIDTMHQYASPSPDSRELVAELEFVWDQVKSNVPSSSSSSPLQTIDQVGTGMSASYSALERQRGSKDPDEYSDQNEDQPLQIKSPMSQSEEELEAEEAEIDRDEFVDAPDSQYALEVYRRGAMDHNLSEANTQPPSKPPKSRRQTPASRPISRRTIEPPGPGTPTPRPRMRHIIPQPIPLPPSYNNAKPDPDPPSAADLKWRKRIETSLMKMTAEVAALREQLEARRLFQHRVHYRFFRALWRFVWAGAKHVAVDLLVLALLLAWMRSKGDRRMEGAVRVLLGDAVAQIKGGRLTGVAMPKVPALPALPALPKLPGLGRKG
ncbi:acyl CoA binding protein-domain-containing protein [Boeremia exigua]|uniref:acyl CoA binding protein-domain-containing protein n=1 Tax=Boeremia exigua TaxID=749465 RepID=UPI001E8E259E|nr:acyl CoA binding protein-domain-containing protein [Boeremia exigua]KAH6642385.1 acyl CoA binding protein-domain-containing protein [Boeremia exigua]